MSWSSLLAQKLRPDENGNLPRLWFLLGSEPLLAIEAQDAIRAAAFKAGYSERKSFVFEGNADYSPLYEALGDQSLFGEKNLIEVVFPRATIGKNGPAAVEAVIEHADEDKMVVVSLFDYDWTATKKDWALPRWITERAKEKNGQTLTPEAANLIAERTEGNLLATSQEIQKLALLVNKPEIDVSDVLDAVSDVSRFDQESLFLAMLEGDARQVSKIIDSLQGENVQIPSFLWMLTDVVRNLLLLNRGFAVRTFGLSEAHRSALNRASRRANPKLLELMLHRLSDVDRMSKGLFVESSDGDAWQELKAVCLRLSLKRK